MHGGGAAYQRRVPGLIGRRWHASRRSREYRQSRGCRPKWCRQIVGHSPAHELAADRQSAIWRLRVAGPGAALFHASRARPSPAAFHNVHTAPFRSASMRRWGIVGAPNSLVSGPGQAHNVFLPLGNQDSLGDGSRRARDRSRRTEPRSRRREKKRALERSGPFSFWFYNAETANNSPPPLIDRRCRSAKGLGPCVPTQEQGNRVSAADCGNPNHRAADLDP
jgi:hypothetical protein